MRRITFLTLILTLIACVCLGVGCEVTWEYSTPIECTEHTGGTATCLKKAVCEVCGEEYGELAEHVYGDWQRDGEKHWKECTTVGCTAKSGEGAHNGGTATCKDKAVCADCGGEYGVLNAENHASTETKFVSNGDGTHNKVHSCCNAVIEENITCLGGEATVCGAKNVCTDCGGEYGEALEHHYADVWSTDGTNHWHACTRDDCTARSDDGTHSGGTATCKDKAVCETCNKPYGELANHSYGDWEHDDENHWKKCTTEGCTAISDEGAHTGGTATCKDKAICETCNKPYGDTAAHSYGDWQRDDDKHWKQCTTEGCTAISDEGAHSYNTWDKSGDDYDYKVCVCGLSDESQKFDKTVSLINQIISLSKSPYSIALGGISDYASVESIVLGHYNFGTDLTALEISDEFKADTKTHGKQTLIVTVKAADDETHKIEVPVTFITAEIADLDEFKAIQPSADRKGVYGYYVLTADISDDKTLNGNAYVAVEWDPENGFFGTLDGQGHTVNMAANGANGLFGILRGATIKNLTITDGWRSAYQYYALLAKATFNSTLENVTFTFNNGNTTDQVGDGYGWISYAEFSGNTLKNVTVNDSKGYGSLFGYKFYNNTFDNVVINGTYAEIGHTADVKDDDGNIVEAGNPVSIDDVTKIETVKVTLDGRQDFILDGGVSVIDLGDYNGSKIISVVTSTGFELASLSSEYVDATFKAAKQKHGEQDVIVTLVHNDKTVVVVIHVTVITKYIKTMSELQAAVKHKGSDIYGYYVLGNDVSVDEAGYVAENATYAWNSGTGFKGTLDGRGKTIAMQGNKSKHGIFGTLNGATIKNVKINNAWYNGWSAAVFGYTAYNTTFENITISVSGNTISKPTDTTKIGVIVGAETGGCSWKDVTINVVNAQYTLFHTLNKDSKTDTFENVTVIIPSLTQFSDNGQPDGVTVVSAS